MKHPHDPGTVDMLPMPKKRGRKPSGSALSGSEKQARYRERQASRLRACAITIRRLSALLSAMSPDVIERVQLQLLEVADEICPDGEF
ncbi:TPA: hypothetical protein MNK97_005591 [Klebsiella pneumoniae]|nr:hypothetical protein [Klebsiella pneumoniae]